MSAWVQLGPHPALTHSPASLQSSAPSYQNPFSSKPGRLSEEEQSQEARSHTGPHDPNVLCHCTML